MNRDEWDTNYNTWLDRELWLEYGWRQGWCGPPVCEMHDGTPMSIEEEDMIFNGEDPCITIIRLYDGPDHAASITENHAPSQWRATGAQWPTPPE